MIKLLFRVIWMLLGWLELGILTLVLYPLSYLPPTDQPRSWYFSLFRLWSQAWVHALGVDLRLHQKNREPLPDHYLLIANHPSAFEDIGIPALFPVCSLAKIEVSDWWIVGRISSAAGTLYVKRDSRDSRQAAKQAIVDALNAGRNIALYPEGGIKGKHLHDHFQWGVFDISLTTGVPIIPVYLHYEALDDFFWGKQHLVRKILELMTVRNNRVNYYVYDAIDPGDFEDKQSYCEAVYQQFVSWQERYQG
ncbi:MAG: lysophospholipid acyltransferase family protein [bacterium]